MFLQQCSIAINMLNELISGAVDFVKVVDISMLSANENRGYCAAILIGVALSPSYIFRLSKENILDCSEFSEKKHAGGAI